MKFGELIFEDDFLFHVLSQWNRPRVMLSQVHCELGQYIYIYMYLGINAKKN